MVILIPTTLTVIEESTENLLTAVPWFERASQNSWLHHLAVRLFSSRTIKSSSSSSTFQMLDTVRSPVTVLISSSQDLLFQLFTMVYSSLFESIIVMYSSHIFFYSFNLSCILCIYNFNSCDTYSFPHCTLFHHSEKPNFDFLHVDFCLLVSTLGLLP